MGKYICDIDDYDNQGRSIVGDQLAPGGRRRRNGTLSTMAHNFEPIPDNMVLADRRNIREFKPTVKEEIIDSIKQSMADKTIELIDWAADEILDWIKCKIALGIENAKIQMSEYKAIRASGYKTKAAMLQAERRKEILSLPNTIDFEEKMREKRAV